MKTGKMRDLEQLSKEELQDAYTKGWLKEARVVIPETDDYITDLYIKFRKNKADVKAEKEDE